MNRVLALLLFTLLCTCVRAQQVVRGTVRDADTQQPLPFVTVSLPGTDPLLGTTTDPDGKFRLEAVTLGRHTLAVTFLGYEPRVLPNVEVTAGKEVVLHLELTESVTQMETVVVTAGRDKAGAINELATVSTRSLSPEEAGRYAASISDPARQAQNFAGVGGGGDDLSNDIVIRGNSPRGLLWRLEGIEIPNPNHFGEAGGSGGGVSMLSSQVLAASDFLTGAFPAEYGNALSGVFDLRFRRGNTEQREFTAGVGLMGLELAAEGPVRRGGDASYLLNYRFSTLSILNGVGVAVAGDFLPNYQDVNYNLTLPTQKLGVFNVFGLVGNNWFSGVFEPEADEPELLPEREESRALTAVAGVRNRLILGEKTYLATVLAMTGVQSRAGFELQESGVFTDDYAEEFRTRTFRLATTLNHKFSAKHLLRAGLIGGRANDRVTIRERDDAGVFGQRFNTDVTGNRYQGFVHWRYRPTDRLTFHTGLHALHNEQNSATSVEPRFGTSYRLGGGQSLNFALGIHSRADDAAVYRDYPELDLTKAAHAVLGYDRSLGAHSRLKAEVYYQHLYNIGVDTATNFASLNARSVFDFIEADHRLRNVGTGRNVGLELTVERFLHEGFYYLATASLYQARYSVDGGTFFSTPFDGGYIANALAGREWPVGTGDRKLLGVNVRFNAAGGQRYTGVDVAASRAAGELRSAAIPFRDQAGAYYRADLGLTYRINRPQATHRFSLNVQNVTNRLNPFTTEFDFDEATGTVRRREETQSGVLPVLRYQIDF